MFTYGAWPYEELRGRIGGGLTIETSFGVFEINTSSNRMYVLRENPTCVRCGITGTTWMLQAHQEKGVARLPPHLNLYHRRGPDSTLPVFGVMHKQARVGYGYTLMTKDHIIPRSKGGSDGRINLQTMCGPCNNKKGNDYEGIMAPGLLTIQSE